MTGWSGIIGLVSCRWSAASGFRLHCHLELQCRGLFTLPKGHIHFKQCPSLPGSLPYQPSLPPSLSLCFLILSWDADVQRRLRAWLLPEAGESEAVLQRGRQPQPFPSRVLAPCRAGRHQRCLPSSSIEAASLCLVGDRGKEALQSRAGRPECDQTNPHLALTPARFLHLLR